MQNTKRDRSVNWEKEEKQLFKHILRPYLPIIENKDLSTKTNRAKVKAWSEITDKFNASNERRRDKKQLMNQWKCLKLNYKKQLTNYRSRLVSKTGGGLKPPSPAPVVIKVEDILPEEAETNDNNFDCDGIGDMVEVILEHPVEQTKTDDNKEEVHLNQPESTKATSTSNLENNSRHNFNFWEASYDDMHQLRLREDARLQVEHQLRMRNMAEMHRQAMANLQLQSQVLQKFLESSNK